MPSSACTESTVADRALGDQLARAHDRGLEARPHRLHREHAALPGRGDDLRGAGQRRGERLLDQHAPCRPGSPPARSRGAAGAASRCRRRRPPGRRQLGVGAVGALERRAGARTPRRAVGRARADRDERRVGDVREVARDQVPRCGPRPAMPQRVGVITRRASGWPGSRRCAISAQPSNAVASPSPVTCQTASAVSSERADVDRVERERQVVREQQRDQHERREQERRDLGDRVLDDRDREVGLALARRARARSKFSTALPAIATITRPANASRDAELRRSPGRARR